MEKFQDSDEPNLQQKTLEGIGKETLIICKDQWKKEMDNYVFSKTIPKIHTNQYKKLTSGLKCLLNNLAHNFDMINSLKLDGNIPEDREIIEIAFRYLTFSLQRFISENIGKKIKSTFKGNSSPRRKRVNRSTFVPNMMIKIYVTN